LFEKDSSSEKMELLEGMLLTEDSKPYLMNVVHGAESRIQEKKTSYRYQTSYSTKRDLIRSGS